MEPRTVLCFGDSNTWGWVPGDDARRHPQADRWPSVMAGELGEGYAVVAEALNSRTTVWDDPIIGIRGGRADLPTALRSHMPVDLVAIMLGTNDLKGRFGLAPVDVARGMGALVDLALASGTGPGGGPPKVLVIAPPTVGPLSGDFVQIYAGAPEKSRELAGWYRGQAELRGCGFLDAAGAVAPSADDGVHLDAAGQHELGRAVAAAVRLLLA
jgi:lysophospholipase L1-like esterase